MRFRKLSAITLVLTIAVLGSGYTWYSANINQEVGYDRTAYCDISKFNTLNDLGKTKGLEPNISISNTEKIEKPYNTSFERKFENKKRDCSMANTNFSKAGNITGLINLTYPKTIEPNTKNYYKTKDLYQNQKGQIILINAGIAV